MTTAKICCLVLLTLGVLAVIVVLVVILTQPKCGPQRYLHGAVAADTETCSAIGRYVHRPLGFSGTMSCVSWTRTDKLQEWGGALPCPRFWGSAAVLLLGCSPSAVGQLMEQMEPSLCSWCFFSLSNVIKIGSSANPWPCRRYKYLSYMQVQGYF